MPSADELKQRIEAAIPGARAEVEGADGQHFSAVVVAPEFAGMPRIQQHRRVMDVFGDELGGRIHALALSTRPE
jgi:stress-induced morphogen